MGGEGGSGTGSRPPLLYHLHVGSTLPSRGVPKVPNIYKRLRDQAGRLSDIEERLAELEAELASDADEPDQDDQDEDDSGGSDDDS